MRKVSAKTSLAAFAVLGSGTAVAMASLVYEQKTGVDIGADFASSAKGFSLMEEANKIQAQILPGKGRGPAGGSN